MLVSFQLSASPGLNAPLLLTPSYPPAYSPFGYPLLGATGRRILKQDRKVLRFDRTRSLRAWFL